MITVSRTETNIARTTIAHEVRPLNVQNKIQIDHSRNKVVQDVNNFRIVRKDIKTNTLRPVNEIKIVSRSIQGPTGPRGYGIVYLGATPPIDGSNSLWVRTTDHQVFAWNGVEWVGAIREIQWQNIYGHNNYLSTSGVYARYQTTTAREFSHKVLIESIDVSHSPAPPQTFQIRVDGVNVFDCTTDGEKFSGNVSETVDANAKIEIFVPFGTVTKKNLTQLKIREVV